MDHTLHNDYLQSAIKQFEYYKHLGEKTIEQLTDEALFWQYNQESNSIATIVRHLSGNMLSRWTDFLTSDGEKEWRNRDTEFDATATSRVDVLTMWNKGWECLFTALQSVQPHDMHTIVYIRNQGHTVTEAINRQLAHYPYHIGQIVFIGKMVQDSSWQSLSVPRGKSSDYNSTMFSEPQRKEHFTDSILGKK